MLRGLFWKQGVYFMPYPADVGDLPFLKSFANQISFLLKFLIGVKASRGPQDRDFLHDREEIEVHFPLIA